MIKAVLADALGTHLDSFQRIIVDPLDQRRPLHADPAVRLHVNDTGRGADCRR